MKQADIEELFSRFAQASPSPKTELNYSNAYTLLVAVILSAQATDSGVNKATEKLFPLADTPQKMLALGEAGLKDKIKTIGLFNTKAKNIIAMSALLLRDYAGQVPEDRAALEALPGVGRKTANVVLQVVFGHETIAVDTHVFRVSNRMGLARGTTPEKVEAGLLKKVPASYRKHAHHWLILHGRYTCLARSPKCSICPVADLCATYRKTAPKITGKK